MWYCAPLGPVSNYPSILLAQGGRFFIIKKPRVTTRPLCACKTLCHNIVRARRFVMASLYDVIYCLSNESSYFPVYNSIIFSSILFNVSSERRMPLKGSVVLFGLIILILLTVVICEIRAILPDFIKFISFIIL